MPLTADEVRVGKRADALVQQVGGGRVLTVRNLAAWMLDVGHPNGCPMWSTPMGAHDESELVHTADVLRAHLDSLPKKEGRYHTGSLEDPTLTTDGVMQLLQMGTHAIAVAVRNYNGEMFRRSLDEVLGGK